MGGTDEPCSDEASSKRIEFVLNGTRYALARSTVEERLAAVAPGAIHTHAVRVNGTWYPVKQAFEAAIGVPRADFISHTARDHLAALGFEVHGEVEARSGGPPRRVPRLADDRPDAMRQNQPDESWHTEANVQAAVVTYLASRGWRIVSVANTASKEHGIDIIATYDDVTVGIEVKGFPSRHYADPARADEMKRTRPGNQAPHWYAQAILAAMRLRGKEPAWRSVVALPDFPRYRSLYDDTKSSLDAADITVWWVTSDGSVRQPS